MIAKDEPTEAVGDFVRMSPVAWALLFGWTNGDATQANCVVERLIQNRSFREIARRHGTSKTRVEAWSREFKNVCARFCDVDGRNPAELLGVKDGP